jgi:hypothetical protein
VVTVKMLAFAVEAPEAEVRINDQEWR